MKILPAKNKISGFNLIELLVIIACIAILIAMLQPATSDVWKAKRINCANNLKILDGGFVVWSQNHDGKFPMQVSAKDGGTMDFISSGSVVVHFIALTNSGLPYDIESKWLVCPSDTRWVYNKPISQLAETNISYFIGMDAMLSNSKSIFLGDRNLEITGAPVKPGLLELNSQSSVGWTKELHYSKSHGLGGNILFGDGHVEFLKPKALNSTFQLATNRLVIP